MVIVIVYRIVDREMFCVQAPHRVHTHALCFETRSTMQVYGAFVNASVSAKQQLLVFRKERPIIGDNPKAHKLTCSGRLPSSVTEA